MIVSSIGYLLTKGKKIPTDEILKVYKMGETPPPSKEFKNTIKTPSGEPDVGSGNFSVKKP